MDGEEAMTLDLGLASRLIAGIRSATPGCTNWDTPGIAAALREVGGTPGAALAAAALAAEDASLTKPSATAFRHHWPKNAGVEQPRASMHVRCPEHPLNVHPCSQCKAEKDAKLKVQASIQGDQVRVAGRKKDDLQRAISLVKESDYGIPIQFTNYRG